MSFLQVFRNKRTWIALAVTWGLLLMLWALGAILIEKRVLPLRAQEGWIAVTSLCAGLAGGLMVCRKKSGTLIEAVGLLCLLLVLALLWCWIAWGGVSFQDGAGKSIIMLAAGCLLAGLVSAGKGKRRKGRIAKGKRPLKARSTQRR